MRGIFQRTTSLWAAVAMAPDGGGAAPVTAQQFESLAKLVDDLKGGVAKVTEAVQQSGEKYLAEVKNLGKASADTKAEVDKALSENVDTKARLKAVEQLVATMGKGGGAEKPKSIGQQFIESDAWKAEAERLKGGVPAKWSIRQTITSATTDAAGSAGDMIAPDRQPGVLLLPNRRMTIRGLLAPGSTSSNSIEYVKETGFTNNAAIQAGEGETKVESTLKFDLFTAPVRTIAHFMVASTQVLADAAGLQSIIDMRLRYGLDLAEENELLNGDGTGVHLSGLIANSTPYDSAFAVTSETSIDVIRKAMLQATLAEWPATGIILHPQDWARIELTKDGEDRYLFAQPQSLATPTMWRLPVVETQAMGITKFMVGAFTPAAQIFDRQGTTVELSTEDSDNFRRNLVTIRAEKRLALAVYREEALIYGDFGEMS